MTQFTAADAAQLAAKGISMDKVEAQLERFRTGFPYLKIDSPSTVGHGITPVDSELEKACLDRWASFLAEGGDVLKFVPASGAASRMFKALFAFVNGAEDFPAAGSAVAELLEHVHDMAFFNDLEAAALRLYGNGVDALLAENRHKDVIRALIMPEGLNYGGLPKALLKFHRYGDVSATALEEQLAEGAEMATNANGKVRMHFTVSADHHRLFDEKLAEVVPAMGKARGVEYEVTLSEQKPSTDTIAVTPDNGIFRDDAGKLVFRPGGHGALIENLGDIDASVVFIKNIDNIATASMRSRSVPYKKILGGMLLIVHDRIESLRVRLADASDATVVDEAVAFVEGILCTSSRIVAEAVSDSARREALCAILDRPLRVCGMVRNEGEPGGGPYNAWSSDGSMISPQILESTQIDTSKPEGAGLMSKATHFNPVDLVCWLRRADGSRYHLPDYVDHATGFISEKSLGGRDLRALELPGLWNGAMSKWNTVFVEVPAYTFTPAKTVNDLMRPAHREE